MIPVRMTIANCIWFLVFLLGSAEAFAADAQDFNSEADAYLSKLTAREEFSGTVLISTNGSVVFAKAYGLANREWNVLNTTNTIFRLGSVTKQFTAMCILILQDEHKLNVTNPVSQYVEDCPKAWRAITIHHLLTHTSGIPNITESPDIEDLERLPTTVAVTVKRLRDRPLNFEPGTTMKYSNSGYILLGYIIERISGMPYDRFVARNIFEPLGMRESGYDHPAEILPHRASGYCKYGTRIINCMPVAMDLPHAAGGLCSTVGDLFIWDQSLYSSRLVSVGALDLMFTPFKGEYCYGWFRYNGGDSIERTSIGGVDFNSGNRVQYWHAGGIRGFQSDVIRFPRERVYIAVLSNLEWANSEGIAEKLSGMYFKVKQ